MPALFRRTDLLKFLLLFLSSKFFFSPHFLEAIRGREVRLRKQETSYTVSKSQPYPYGLDTILGNKVIVQTFSKIKTAYVLLLMPKVQDFHSNNFLP